mgnify:CR=1 FL=1
MAEWTCAATHRPAGLAISRCFRRDRSDLCSDSCWATEPILAVIRPLGVVRS